ncbi:MAG: SDR family NAD(P)-dependent oxidoreductase [Polyangiaceae bacterium]
MTATAAAWRSAIVTGASSGIGRALAIELAQRGVRELALVARRAPELEQAAREVEAAGARALVRVVDLADGDRAAAALRAIDDDLDGVDLVVANAGLGPRRDADPLAWETVRDALHVNVCGAAATLTALAPRMRDRRRGHLVGVGSISSFGALPEALAYSSPKAALTMMLDCLRLDLAGAGVAVTAVHLGFVRTAMTAHSTHWMPQLMEAEDCARALVNRLEGRPRAVTLPRALGVAARGLALLPEPLREGIAKALRSPR